MTSLMDRLAGTAEPEEKPVTAPRPRYSAVPWWAGVYGLDPAMPVTDWDTAAQCTAMACAVYAFGDGAACAEGLLGRKGSPVTRMCAWLLEAVSPEDATRRRLALRLACEMAALEDADRIIAAARVLHDSCSPGRR